jgi:hypothetical protein
MSRRVIGIVCGLILIAVLMVLSGEVQGCGGAYRLGERVDVADETALIIWDEATKTEHFIRSATFVGSAYDFGFLVPSPSKPELNDADSDLFKNLASITKPKVEYREETHISVGCGGGSVGSSKSLENALPAGVVVLEQKRVGGFDAAVLGFRKEKNQDLKDAAAEFLDWLNRNQYAVRPDLEEWLIPYIRDNWVITAFKIAAQSSAEPGTAINGVGKSETHTEQKNIGLKSSAVRMSFQTDKPFFPYREPSDQRDEKAGKVPRLLRVFIAAKQRMSGKLGNGTSSWPGQTKWADALKDEERRDILKRTKLLDTSAPGGWWLTEFEDRSTPRPGTDEIYFEPSADRTPVARHPEIIVSYRDPWWAGLVCIGVPLILASGFIWIVTLMIRTVLLSRYLRRNEKP